MQTGYYLLAQCIYTAIYKRCGCWQSIQPVTHHVHAACQNDISCLYNYRFHLYMWCDRVTWLLAKMSLDCQQRFFRHIISV